MSIQDWVSVVGTVVMCGAAFLFGREVGISKGVSITRDMLAERVARRIARESEQPKNCYVNGVAMTIDDYLDVSWSRERLPAATKDRS